MPDLQLEERICAYPHCRQTFQPIRRTQRFHSTVCRKAYWREAYHWTPHPCPLCTVWHDPEERPILDALESILQDGLDVAIHIEELIVRRRAILAGAGLTI